jgi:CDP-4-dehydro-6-deoxyglucose reductase, E3
MRFTITIEPSGASFHAGRDEPVLAAAMAQGVGLPYGCRDGACGSCKCQLLEGRVIHGAHQVKALSQAEEDAGLILTCCAAPQTDVRLRVQAHPSRQDFPVQKMPCRVMQMERPAPDVMVLQLQLPAASALRYRPGQYVNVTLPSGVQRSYSMASVPPPPSDRPSITLHIRHLPGGAFTDHVFGALKPKDILRLEGPLGSFCWREDSNKPVVLVASGTGFAPIVAMLEQLRSSTLAPRPTVLYWGARRRIDLYAHERALQLAQALPWLRYVPVLSQAHPDDAWSGRTGLVHQAVLADLPDLSAHQVYACGAPAMVRAAQHDFVALAGLPAEEFFADAFTSQADSLSL